MRRLGAILTVTLALTGCGESEPGATRDTSGSTEDAAGVDAQGDAKMDAGPESEPLKTTPVLGEVDIIIPGSGMPAGVETQLANNNLDIVTHEGRFFLAFRTGPWHFADPDVHMYVVSTDDEPAGQFELELSLHMQTDLRECRFLSWNGRLFLYFAVLGDNGAAFEPQGIMFSEYIGPGQWTEPEWIFDDTFIVWRTKVVDEVPYMVGYTGGGDIYLANEGKLQVRFLTTTDGVEWTGVDPDKEVVTEGGGSETAFVRLEDGTVVAVQRNEKGDETGWGSKICTAPPDAPADWDCVSDKRKFDSPLMFRHGEAVYLIARRNLNGSGNYDLEHDEGTFEEKTTAYLLDYSLNPKRCSLWQVDPDTRTVTLVEDLPSQGDTCFPGIVQVGTNEYLLYNYTSPLDGDDPNWVDGQLGPTLITRQTLTFE